MTGARLVPYVWAPAVAARIALWMGDVNRARDAMQLVRASTEHGRYVAALCHSLEAGLAALEGHRDEAIRLYREAADAMRELDLPLDLARCQMEYAMLVSPDDPGARAAAEEARAILTRLGSPPLLARLEAGLALWEPAETRAISESPPTAPTQAVADPTS